MTSCKKIFGICITIGLLLASTKAAKILAILGTDMNSHFRAMTGVLEAIAPYHDITFYVHPKFKYEFQNVTTKKIPPFDINKDLTKNSPLQDPCKVNDYDIYINLILHNNMQMYDTVFTTNYMRDLMNQRGVYDLLIICAYGSQHFILLAHHLQLNMIQVSPSFVDVWVSEAIANNEYWDNNLAFTISDKSNSLYGRTKRYLKNAYILYRYNSNFASTINKAAHKHFPPGTPSLSEIMLRRTELVFLNTHSAMGMTKPSSPAIIEIGGSHISPPKPLSSDLHDFINSAEHGVIYFSFGTVVKGESMNKNVIRAMLDTFAKLKQKVLWKIQDNLENVPKNVKFGKWFPQQDILRHKNTKVFITQGGMLSMIEASTFGVPTLIMPALFDQKTIAQKAEELGYGITLHFCEFTQDKFYESIVALLKNPQYKEKAEQVSEIMQRDQRNLKEKINFWTNFVLKNQGKSILRTAEKQSFLQTMAADIFIMLLSITIIVIISLKYAITKLVPKILKNNIELKEHQQ